MPYIYEQGVRGRGEGEEGQEHKRGQRYRVSLATDGMSNERLNEDGREMDELRVAICEGCC